MSSQDKKKVEIEEKKEQKEGKEVQEDEDEPQDTLLVLSDQRFKLTLPESLVSAASKAEIKTQIVDRLKEDSMEPFYTYLVGTGLDINIDAATLEAMKVANTKALADFDEKIVEARENAGQSEIHQGKVNKANFLVKIGDKENATILLKECLDEAIGSGARIDLAFALIRLGLAFDDRSLQQQYIEKAKTLVEAGGDWERKNLLSVYVAIGHVIAREFKPAASIFMPAVATFTNTKLFSYKKLVFYTVLSAVVSVDRVTIKQKVLESPDILSVISDIPDLGEFVNSLYDCRYASYFRSLSSLADDISTDIYLARHIGFWIREARLVAYRQFLDPFRSVTLSNMSEAFGVSSDFLDRELSRFIAAGRISCKLDKVSGIIETSPPDTKNLQYQRTIKQGDVLLNRIQKLTKIISY